MKAIGDNVYPYLTSSVELNLHAHFKQEKENIL